MSEIKLIITCEDCEDEFVEVAEKFGVEYEEEAQATGKTIFAISAITVQTIAACIPAWIAIDQKQTSRGDLYFEGTTYKNVTLQEMNDIINGKNVETDKTVYVIKETDLSHSNE